MINGFSFLHFVVFPNISKFSVITNTGNPQVYDISKQPKLHIMKKLISRYVGRISKNYAVVYILWLMPIPYIPNIPPVDS